MTDKVGTGYVPIKPDTEGFGPELEKGLSREGVPAAERGAQNMQRAMLGVFTAGAAILAKSVFDAAGFDRQMREVFTLLPGISGDAMGEMTAQVQDFSKEFGILPQEVVPALYSSLSAGVPADNVFAFMETATKLAKGGVTELEVAVDGLSGTVNAYGTDVLSAQQASDMMFKTVTLGKTTIAELAASLFQVTPTAAGLGVQFGDVSAALAAMTLQSVPTSVATTQLRQLFVELSKDGSKAAATFEDLSGKKFRDFIAGGGNVQQALQVMEVGAADAGLAISDMFGSVEAGSAALVLTGGGTEAFTNALDGMANSAGATDAAFDTMNAGLASTMDRLKARFSVALIQIGTAIAPTVEIIGTALAGVLDLFSVFPGEIQAVVLVFLTLTAGVFAFSKQITATIGLMSKLGGVFSMLAANPWVLVAAGLVLAAVLIIKHWDEVKEMFVAFVDFFYTLWTGFEYNEGAGPERWALKVREVFATIFQSAQEFLALTVGAIVGAWSAVVDATTAAWSAVFGTVTGVGGAIVGFITGIPGTIVGAFQTLAGIISAPFIAAFAAIKASWNSTVGGFGFDTPSWVPGFGGKSFTIPSMETGGVLSGPTLFLGGEYANAQRDPEIVAPQSVIRETMIEALSAGSAAGTIVNLSLQIDSEVRDPAFFERQATELVRVVQRELDRERRAAGRSGRGVAA